MESKSFIFSFGDVEVREREFTLARGGVAQPVEPKTFRVLLILLKSPQKLVPKEELVKAVWGDVAVSDNSLTRCIAALRRVLGDDARQPRYIETVTTVGYRFLSPVKVVEDGAPESAETEAPAPVAIAAVEAKRSGARRWVIGGVAVAALGLTAWNLSRPMPPPRIKAYTQLTHDGNKKWVAGTDGSRIYLLLQSETDPVGEVSVSGGEIGHIAIPMRNIATAGLIDVSPDGSNFLVQSNEKGYGKDRPVWNVRMPEGSSRGVPGLSSGGRFSPDGKLVTYATANREIWVVGSDGANARKLSSGPITAGTSQDLEMPKDFAWSPDGRLIRFSKGSRLWEISAEGRNLHEVLVHWPSGAHDCGNWTQDGRFFLFRVKQKWYDWGGQLWALDERRGLLRHGPGDPVQLTTGPIVWGCPVSSRDGKQIFATGWTSRGELQRFDATTRQLQPFLNGISAVGATFSRDGQRVAYVKYDEGTLWTANRDGSHAVQLTYPPAHVVMPRWSPDGTQISFTDPKRTPINSYLVPASGGAPRILSPGNIGTDAGWSPDGKRIIFSNSGAQPHDLRILDFESQRVAMLPGSAGTYSPRWSPDGRFVAALPDDSLSVKIFDLRTEKWATFPQPDVVGYPQWSSDSRFIYFLRTNTIDGTGVYRLRVANGETELVIGLKGFHMTGWWFQWLGLDASDAPLVLKDIGTHDVYALTLEEK